MSDVKDEYVAAREALRAARAACRPERDAVVAAQNAISNWFMANKPAGGWPRDEMGIQWYEIPDNLHEADLAAHAALRAKRKAVGHYEAVERYHAAHLAYNANRSSAR
jgi:hypothetical protein